MAQEEQEREDRPQAASAEARERPASAHEETDRKSVV